MKESSFRYIQDDFFATKWNERKDLTDSGVSVIISCSDNGIENNIMQKFNY
jgi:hypothetical protein